MGKDAYQPHTQKRAILLRISIATTKHHDKNASWGGKVYSAYTCYSLLKEVRTGIQTGQDPEGTLRAIFF